MFWGCFLYDQKGPSHCWASETAQEKKAAVEAIEEINNALEPVLRDQWELTNGLQRMNIRTRQTPGPKPQWRWNKKTGKVTQGLGKGID